MMTPVGYNAYEQELIQSALPASEEWRARFISMVPTTQDAMRVLIEQGEKEHLVFVASHQTDARGRQGRVWHQQPGQDISFSVLLEPRDRYPALLLPMLMATAVYECVTKHLKGTGHELRIKWPNDLLADGKKLAGILIEAEGEGLWIAGIGINVNRLEFPKELEATSTSLTLMTGAYEDRAAVLAELLRLIVRLVGAAERGDLDPVIEGFGTGLGLIGERVVATTGAREVTGVLGSVSPDAVVVGGTRLSPGEVRGLVRQVD